MSPQVIEASNFLPPSRKLLQLATGKKRGKKIHATDLRTTKFYKTKLCPFMATKKGGRCSEGLDCGYAHSEEELREYPSLRCTKWCHKALQGLDCTDSNCAYAHSSDELHISNDLHTLKTSICTFWKKKPELCLNGNKCRFAHGEIELRHRSSLSPRKFPAFSRRGAEKTSTNDLIPKKDIDGIKIEMPKENQDHCLASDSISVSTNDVSVQASDTIEKSFSQNLSQDNKEDNSLTWTLPVPKPVTFLTNLICKNDEFKEEISIKSSSQSEISTTINFSEAITNEVKTLTAETETPSPLHAKEEKKISGQSNCSGYISIPQRNPHSSFPPLLGKYGKPYENNSSAVDAVRNFAFVPAQNNAAHKDRNPFASVNAEKSATSVGTHLQKKLSGKEEDEVLTDWKEKFDKIRNVSDNFERGRNSLFNNGKCENALPHPSNSQRMIHERNIFSTSERKNTTPQEKIGMIFKHSNDRDIRVQLGINRQNIPNEGADGKPYQQRKINNENESVQEMGAKEKVFPSQISENSSYFRSQQGSVVPEEEMETFSKRILPDGNSSKRGKQTWPLINEEGKKQPHHVMCQRATKASISHSDQDFEKLYKILPSLLTSKIISQDQRKTILALLEDIDVAFDNLTPESPRYSDGEFDGRIVSNDVKSGPEPSQYVENIPRYDRERLLCMKNPSKNERERICHGETTHSSRNKEATQLQEGGDIQINWRKTSVGNESLRGIDWPSNNLHQQLSTSNKWISQPKISEASEGRRCRGKPSLNANAKPFYPKVESFSKMTSSKNSDENYAKSIEKDVDHKNVKSECSSVESDDYCFSNNSRKEIPLSLHRSLFPKQPQASERLKKKLEKEMHESANDRLDDLIHALEFFLLSSRDPRISYLEAIGNLSCVLLPVLQKLQISEQVDTPESPCCCQCQKVGRPDSSTASPDIARSLKRHISEQEFLSSAPLEKQCSRGSDDAGPYTEYLSRGVIPREISLSPSSQLSCYPSCSSKSLRTFPTSFNPEEDSGQREVNNRKPTTWDFAQRREIRISSNMQS